MKSRPVAVALFHVDRQTDISRPIAVSSNCFVNTAKHDYVN